MCKDIFRDAAEEEPLHAETERVERGFVNLQEISARRHNMCTIKNRIDGMHEVRPKDWTPENAPSEGAVVPPQVGR